MTILEHRWNVTPDEAEAIQERLRGIVVPYDQSSSIQTVAGVDVAYDADTRRACAAVVVLSFPGKEFRGQATAVCPTTFPYIPGMLSFREIPSVLEALQQLQQPPDLLLCDGQGIAHPRRFGLACHLGVLTGIASIGVAKTRFIGRHEPVPPERGAWTPLLDGEERVGAVLRTRTGVRPVYVSVGHRVCLETAVKYVLCCTPRFRLPEPLRLADNIASNWDTPDERGGTTPGTFR